MVNIGLALFTSMLLLTFSLVLSKALLSFCSEQRFYNQSLYICNYQNQEDAITNGLTNLISYGFYVSIIVAVLTIPKLYFFSKNFLEFLNSINSNTSHSSQNSLGQDASYCNQQQPIQTQQQTMQNMLDCDSEFTRRSLKPPLCKEQQQPQANKGLYQINEDEEEQLPFSPSKQNHTEEGRVPTAKDRSILGENKNIMNRQNSSTKKHKNLLLAVPKPDYDNESMNGLPQFSSCNKSQLNDESYIQNHQFGGLSDSSKNTASMTQIHSRMVLTQMGNSKGKLIRPKSKQNTSSRQLLQSAGGFSDTSTVMDATTNQNTNKLNHLEGIEEVEDEIRKSHNFMQLGKVELSQTSKEESKDEDSSRIVMFNIINQSHSENSPTRATPTEGQISPIRKIMTILIILTLFLTLVLCSLFILYSLFNQTLSRLSQNLKIFALSLLFDFFIIRPLTIAIGTIFTVYFDLKYPKKFQTCEDDLEALSLLGEMYEEYERPLQMLVDVTEIQSFKIEEPQSTPQNYDIERAMDSSKPFSEDAQQRIINHYGQTSEGKVQQKKRKYGDIVLVESTYFYHQTGMPLPQNRQQQISLASNTQNDEYIQRQKFKKARPSAPGEKVGYTGTLQYNAMEEQQLQLHKAYTERLEIHGANGGEDYDIEEIPLHSARAQQNQRDELFLNQLQEPTTNQQDMLTSERDPNSMIFPNLLMGNHFETPKGINANKSINLLQGNNQVQDNQQLLRESVQDQKLLLKDLLLLNSGSSKKKHPQYANQQDFQSLQRYLDGVEDKENVNSANKKSILSTLIHNSLKKESIRSSNRKSAYIQQLIEDKRSPTDRQILKVQMCQQQYQDEIINFVPQYNSLRKDDLLKSSSANNLLRKSLQPQSDYKNVQICTDLQKSQMKLRGSRLQTAKKSNKENSSPSKIAENIEQRLNQKQSEQVLQALKPNVSPFNEKINTTNQQEEKTMGEPYSMLIDQETEKFRITNLKCDDSQLNKSNMSLRNFIQPQGVGVKKSKDKSNGKGGDQTKLPQQIDIKQSQNLADQIANLDLQNPQTKIKVEPVDANSKNGNKKKSKKSKNKKQEAQIMVFEESKMQTSKKLMMFTEQSAEDNHSEEYLSNQQLNMDLNDESKFEDTVRSKLYEDSDTSTFRMITFSKNKSKADFNSTNPIQQQTCQSNSNLPPIDFYSSTSKPNPLDQDHISNKPAVYDYQTQQQQQDFKRSKKASMAEIIVEEDQNEIKNSLSPEKINRKSQPKEQEILVLQTDDSAISNQNEIENKETNNYPDILSQDEEDEIDGEFNLLHQMMNMKQHQNNQNFFRTDSLEEEQMEMKFCKRAPSKLSKKDLISQGGKRNKTKSQVRSSKNESEMGHGRAPSLSGYPSFENTNLKNQEALRKAKEQEELLSLRIEEQKRKLKHFLKLAKQLRSQKDIKKIKDMLAFLKQTMKPLPLSKMNELKLLEIMSSPYNQSLIAMLKDEYEQYQKNERPPTQQKKAKSQNRQGESLSTFRKGEVIQKLNGIYGHQVGNLQSTNRAKSRESSIDVKPISHASNRLKPKSQQRNSSVLPNGISRSRFSNVGGLRVVDQSQNTNQSSQLQYNDYTPQVIEIVNGMTTSEEGDSERGQRINQGHISKIEIMDDDSVGNANDSVEFNDLQNFMSQQQQHDLPSSAYQ